jgi:membrane protease YdiL (CAAX protease family)
MNFIEQAYKGRNDWYWYIIVISIVGIAWQFLGGIPFIIAAMMHLSNPADFAAEAATNFTNIGIDKNLYLFLMIFTFIVGLAALLLCVRSIHQRSITSLVTSRTKMDWKRFWFAFVLWGCISISFILIGIFMSPEDYVWNFSAKPFFILVAISFLFIPLQTSFEELLFRGYLMQGLGIMVKNRWFPLIVTSIIFGVLHMANPEVDKLGPVVMVFYIGTGLLFGIVTLMDEGTELALGLHAINNIVAAFMVTTDWTVFQTNALYIDTSEPSVGMEMFFPVFVLYPTLLFLFGRKYQWSNWKDKLFGAVEPPVKSDELNEIGG